MLGPGSRPPAEDRLDGRRALRLRQAPNVFDYFLSFTLTYCAVPEDCHPQDSPEQRSDPEPFRLDR